MFPAKGAAVHGPRLRWEAFWEQCGSKQAEGALPGRMGGTGPVGEIPTVQGVPQWQS